MSVDENQAKNKAVFKRWRESPVAFVEECLGVRPEIDSSNHITDQQRDGLKKLGIMVNAKIKSASGKEMGPRELEYSKKMGLSIMSGHGVGKDAYAAWAILWFIICFKYPKIPCTAPNADQLQSVLWSEISKWMSVRDKDGNYVCPMRDELEFQSRKLFMKNLPDKKEKPGSRWFAEARTVSPNQNPEKQAETLAGRHEDNMMYLVDEACHDDQTEVMTRSGWKKFSELRLSDKLLSMNETTHEACYLKPKHLIKHKYKGFLHSYDSRNANFSVTPLHKMFFKTRKSGWQFKAIGEIGKQKIYTPKGFKWTGIERTVYRVPGKKNGRAVTREDLVLDMDLWLELLGWYISEGSIGRSRSKQPTSVTISQMNKRYRQEIVICAKRLGLNPKEYKHEIGIHDTRIAVHLSRLGKSINKKVPSYVKALSPRQIGLFLASFEKGDGYRHNGNPCYYTSSKALADGIQELELKRGRNSSITRRAIKGQRKFIVDHWATSNHDGYVVRTSNTNTDSTINIAKIKKVAYDGFVYCADVPPWHLLFTRRNGKCLWSGNSGVPDPVFRPFEGTLTGVCNFIIMIFNPTQRAGYAFKSHYGEKAETDQWIKLHWDAEKSELVSKEQIERIADKYGRSSNYFLVRVKGLPPNSDEDSLIPDDWVYAAQERTMEGDPRDPVFMGVDCAMGGGDEAAIAIRKGPKVEKIYTFSKAMKTHELGTKVIDLMVKHEVDICFIDPIGVGKGVYDYVSLLCKSEQIQPVDVRDKAYNNDRFYRLRDELWWKMRVAFERGLMDIPVDDGELRSQLSSIKYENSVQHLGNCIKIESKARMKKRGRGSPDRADALMITFMRDAEVMRMDRDEDAYDVKEPVVVYENSWMTA